MIPDFWKITARQWRSLFFRIDFPVVILSSVAIGLLPDYQTLASRFDLIMATKVGVTVGLLGLVLAALAVVIAFLNEGVLRILESNGGLSEDIWPFSFTALLAGVTAATALGALIVVPTDKEWMLRASVAVTWGLFLWTLFSAIALIRVVHGYGRIRAASDNHKLQP